MKTKNPVGYSPTRSLFYRGFFKDFRGLNPACGVSSKCSPPELRSYKQNQGRGYLFRTLPEVNPKFSIPQKFSGTKDVGAYWLVVGRRGLHSHGLGGQEESLETVLLEHMLYLTYVKIGMHQEQEVQFSKRALDYPELFSDFSALEKTQDPADRRARGSP
ncbi:hypothetical protein [Solidesulfovibrio sp.]